MSAALRVPHYVKAKSPEALRRLMFENNAKRGAFFTYQISFGNGEWVAWYYEDVRFIDAVSSVKNESDNKGGK